MEKSITRRIIAIIFSACGAGVLSFLAISGEKDALVALVAIVSTIGGFYFGVKERKT